MAFKRKKKYQPEDAPEQNFTGYIVKGNRQVVKREVIASKRFRVDEETYLIKPECIFLKNIDGNMRSVSYYREGNPNPYDFRGDNKGITADELDRVFSEDFFHIVTNLQPEKKIIYVLVLAVINLFLTILFAVGVGLIGYFG